MEVKDAKSYKRALAKVGRTVAAVLEAKGDDAIVEAVEAHEKAKKSLGKVVGKVNG